MRFVDRYKGLSFSDKLAVWGTVTSILGLILTVVLPLDSIWARLLHGEHFPIAATFSSFDPGDRVYPGATTNTPYLALQYEYRAIPVEIEVHISITSRHHSPDLMLPPYVFVDLLKCEPFPASNVGVEILGKGDGGEIGECLAVLSPERMGIYPAPRMNFYNGSLQFPEYDYYSLQYGENAEIFLYCYPTPGHIYTFRVGIPYKRGKKTHVLWSRENFTVGYPRGDIPIHYTDYENGWYIVETRVAKVWCYQDNVLPEAQAIDQQSFSSRLFSPDQFATNSRWPAPGVNRRQTNGESTKP